MGTTLRFALAGLLLATATATSLAASTATGSTTGSAPDSVASTPSAGASAAVEVTPESFRCIHEMTPVRGFFVDNLLGHLDETLAVARSPTGGTYPPGSVVQLFPNEVMVKRETGFSPVTRDWEFFELDVSEQGTTIRKRGFADVKNRFGGNCFACHVQAKPEWDLVCEQDHGCEKLPVSRYAIHALQNADPRCDNRDTPVMQRATDWVIRALTPL